MHSLRKIPSSYPAKRFLWLALLLLMLLLLVPDKAEAFRPSSSSFSTRQVCFLSLKSTRRTNESRTREKKRPAVLESLLTDRLSNPKKGLGGSSSLSSSSTSSMTLFLSSPEQESTSSSDDVLETTTTTTTKELLSPTERILLAEKGSSTNLPSQKNNNNPVDVPKPYPLDIPSPILLATSMVLAITSVGSLFELGSSNGPTLGFATTAALAALCLPTAIFVFYAAILKGQAETEQDDQAFMKK